VNQLRGHQPAAHDAHRRHHRCASRGRERPYQTPAGLNTDQLLAWSTISQARHARPLKEGTGQSTLRLPVARTESRLSARAPDPPPLAQNDATSFRTSPGKITNDPAEIVNTNRPENRQRSRRTQPTARTTPTQKTGLNQMLKTPRHAPKDRPAMSKPTTYNSSPVKSGEVTETGKPSNEASEGTTPTGGVKPERQQPRAIRPPGFPRRACARPTGQALGAGERPCQQRQSADPARRPRKAAAALTRAQATSQG
jgi:hypothetical protein